MGLWRADTPTAQQLWTHVRLGAVIIFGVSATWFPLLLVLVIVELAKSGGVPLQLVRDVWRYVVVLTTLIVAASVGFALYRCALKDLGTPHAIGYTLVAVTMLAAVGGVMIWSVGLPG